MGNVRVRQLPVEEWERLRGLPIAARTMPDPERSFILVAEDEGEIVKRFYALLEHANGEY